MERTTGYKGMLRDRCPTLVDQALKWQKAKERWINHTYQSFIKIFCDKNERYRVTRIILGIAKNNRDFDFEKSIDWDNLSKEEEEYWKRVQSWVSWFSDNYSEIKSEYQSSLASGEDEFTTKVNIINNHLSSLLPDKDADEEEKQAKYDYVDRLVDFLVKCFRKSILIKGIMLNVFSDSNQKMTEQIQALQKCAGSSYTRLLFAGPEDEPLYILKPKVIEILKWVNRRILFELPRVKTYSDAQWVGVRIRIATNQFNKQVDEGILTKEVAIEYHKRMTSHVRRILGEIYTEDLPFLP